MVIAEDSRSRTQQAQRLTSGAQASAKHAPVTQASATHTPVTHAPATRASATWTAPVRVAVTFALTAACVVGLAGCSAMHAANSAHSVATDEAAIAEFNRQYLGAINDGDIAKLSSLTTDGHIMIPPGRPPIVGKAANDAANGAGFERVRIDEHWTPVETVVSGDLAYQRGTYTVVATPKAGGDARKMSGTFLRIYQRQPDGAWRMTHDMFNSDTQSPSP